MKSIQLLIDSTSLHSIKTILINRNETLAIVENNSTGGLLQAMLALTENSDQFFTGGIVINNYKKNETEKLLNPANENLFPDNIPTIADQFSNDIANKFSTDWGLAIIGENVVGKTSGTSWLAIQYKQKMILSIEVSQPRNGLRTADVIVQEVVMHFLRSIMSWE
ncbi:MAG: CinA family protein [Chitinophagaceae bacterium]